MAKMMFGTPEWFDAFMNRLKADEKYRESAKNFEGSLIFRCLAEPGVHPLLENDLCFWFDPFHGDVRAWKALAPGETADATWEITASYKNWKAAAKGELDVKKAVLLTRQIKVKGKVTALLKHLSAATRTIGVLSEMTDEFQFPDEAPA
ncbi:MAG: SCP2 sterol-binding domain-containing protein [Proteobacteria bacterium]|nr:SCP2 sterol-binding domain-containing protein [Pseudomonadota bacterium]